MNTTRHNQTRKTERIKAFVGFVVMNGHNQIAPDKPRFHLITRRSQVQILSPQPHRSKRNIACSIFCVKKMGAAKPRPRLFLLFFLCLGLFIVVPVADLVQNQAGAEYDQHPQHELT